MKGMHMNAGTPAGAAGIEAAMASLDELETGELEELDLGAEIGSEIEEEVVATLDAYEGMEAGSAVTLEAPAEAAAKPAKKAKAPKTAKAPKVTKPRVERDLTKLDLGVFQLDASVVADAANRDAVLATKPTQKKIAEKFENIFIALNANRAPSTFVTKCLTILVSATTVDTTAMKAALKASARKNGEEYKEGTTASQVGQIMSLFAILGIATRTGQSLTYNPASVIANKLIAFA